MSLDVALVDHRSASEQTLSTMVATIRTALLRDGGVATMDDESTLGQGCRMSNVVEECASQGLEVVYDDYNMQFRIRLPERAIEHATRP
ncbi:hypothetical protein ACRAVF_27175 [Bradyrhizobium oligotrophicum S58]